LLDGHLSGGDSRGRAAGGVGGATSPTSCPDTLTFKDQTVREIVHLSLGGTRLRVTLANTFGDTAIRLGAVHVAVRDAEARTVAGTDRTVTFGGRSSIDLPAKASIVSDEVPLAVSNSADLAVSVYLPDKTTATTVHSGACQTSYVSATGDTTAQGDMPVDHTITVWPFLNAVSVKPAHHVRGIAILGDSITDGAGSTRDANHRWPDFFAARLLAPGGHEAGVMNAGLGGNRVLHNSLGQSSFGQSALARFDRDVLSLPGLTDLIVFEGINDIGHAKDGQPQAVSGEDIVAGLKILVERAHEHGLRAFACTVAPYEVAHSYDAAGEAKRQVINAWVRSGAGLDGWLDFDKVLRDPSDPTRLLPGYDSGDHLHPNDAGYQAIAESIDLSLFR
jgi:lysophospholipase L1-like esterase